MKFLGWFWRLQEDKSGSVPPPEELQRGVWVHPSSSVSYSTRSASPRPARSLGLTICGMEILLPDPRRFAREHDHGSGNADTGAPNRDGDLNRWLP